MHSELADILQQGGHDLTRTAGEELRFYRGGSLLARCPGVLTPDALTWGAELGGIQAKQSAHADVQVRALGAYKPEIGDHVKSSAGRVYRVMEVTRAVYDPAYHLYLERYDG